MYPIEVIHEISKIDSRAKLNDIELFSACNYEKEGRQSSFVS